MKYKGYKGQLLVVNLSKGTIDRRGLDEAILEKYIGGRGLAARILYDEIKTGADPYSHDNRLLFITGPAAGAPRRSSAQGKPPSTTYLHLSDQGWLRGGIRRRQD